LTQTATRGHHIRGLGYPLTGYPRKRQLSRFCFVAVRAVSRKRLLAAGYRHEIHPDRVTGSGAMAHSHGRRREVFDGLM
jgi:hypothetical protein